MSWRNNEGLKECNKERGEAKRRKASHELEPYLQLKVALHWLSTLISPKPLQGGRGLGKSTRPEHHQETWIGAPGGGKGGIVAARAFSCTLYVSKVKWMRQEELFFSLSLSVFVHSVLSVKTGAEREGRRCQVKDPTHPFCPYRTRLCLSSICYLRLPFS